MKKYFAVIALFFAATVFCYSQNGPQQRRINTIMNGLYQSCKITSGQAALLVPMVQNFVNTAAANRKQYAGNKIELKTANQTNRENFKANLETVLSPAQMEQFKQYMQQKRQPGPGAPTNEGNQEQ